MNKISFAINGLFSFFLTIIMEKYTFIYANKHYFEFAIAFPLSAIPVLDAKS